MRKEERERRRHAKHLAQKRRRRENIVKDAERRLRSAVAFDLETVGRLRDAWFAAHTLKGPQT